jgi:hypothetical protein
MRHPGPLVARSCAAVVPRPVAVATARPTPEFVRHYDVAAPQVDRDAFRPGWQVATRLHALLDLGRIDREEFDFALEWRRCAEVIAPSHTSSFSPRVDKSVGPADKGMLLRVRAAGWLRECSDALGPLRIKLLEACVLHDRSWVDVAALIRVSDKTAVNYVVEAIEALADWHSGRAVAPPPVLRYRIEPGRQ